jgi:hypothetical protein
LNAHDFELKFFFFHIANLSLLPLTLNPFLKSGLIKNLI